MNSDRRAILWLVAMGRISVAEAERLILAWHDTHEWIWIAAAFVVACILQYHPHIRLDGIGNLAYTVVTHGTKALHAAASVGLKRIGGTV